MGNIPRKHAVDTNLYAGMRFAKLCQGRKQRVDRTLVDAKGKFAALQTFEFHQAFLDFVAKVEQPFGVFLEKNARVGEPDRARAADKQRLAQRILELADGQADRRLRAVEPFRRRARSCLRWPPSEKPGVH